MSTYPMTENPLGAPMDRAEEIRLADSLDRDSARAFGTTAGLIVTLTGLTPAVSFAGRFQFDVGRVEWIQVAVGVALFAAARLLKDHVSLLAMAVLSTVVAVATVGRHGMFVGTGGVFHLEGRADWLLTAGLVMTLAATTILSCRRRSRLVVLATAVGGGLLAVWMFVPRHASYHESWFGLDRIADTIPVMRAAKWYSVQPEDVSPLLMIYWYTGMLVLLLATLESIALPFSSRKQGPTDRASAIHGYLFTWVSAAALIPMGNAIQRTHRASRGSNDAVAGALGIVEPLLREAETYLPPFAIAGVLLVSLSMQAVPLFPVDDRAFAPVAAISISVPPPQERSTIGSIARFTAIIGGTIAAFFAVLFGASFLAR